MERASLLRFSSDQRLAEQVAAGSDRAFEALYDRWRPSILAFCRHMLGSREEAEDAFQHTFMAAYADLGRSGPPAAVRPWLFTIARNHCISVLRARRELPAAELPERAINRLAADVDVREEVRAVFAGLARLPEDQRAALVLAELGDVSHDEIARVLDCRREQVKSYVFQARVALAADRVARDTPCAEIRAQLVELRGGALRRNALRRHLSDCPGCRAFRDTMRAQRRQLRLLLPVAPGFGLKRTVLGALLGGGGSGGAIGVSGLATALVAIAIPAGGVAFAWDDGPPARPVALAASGGGEGTRGPGVTRPDRDSMRAPAAPAGRRAHAEPDGSGPPEGSGTPGESRSEAEPDTAREQAGAPRAGGEATGDEPGGDDRAGRGTRPRREDRGGSGEGAGASRSRGTANRPPGNGRSENRGRGTASRGAGNGRSENRGRGTASRGAGNGRSENRGRGTASRGAGNGRSENRGRGTANRDAGNGRRERRGGTAKRGAENHDAGPVHGAAKPPAGSRGAGRERTDPATDDRGAANRSAEVTGGTDPNGVAHEPGPATGRATGPGGGAASGSDNPDSAPASGGTPTEAAAPEHGPPPRPANGNRPQG